MRGYNPAIQLLKGPAMRQTFYRNPGLLCSFCALSIAITLSAAPNYGAGRTLDSADLWTLFAGGDVNGRCCGPVIACGTPQVSCGDQIMGSCAITDSITQHAGNKNDCVGEKNGAVCTRADTTHICLDSAHCTWDVATNACVEAGEIYTVSAPDTCTNVGC